MRSTTTQFHPITTDLPPAYSPSPSKPPSPQYTLPDRATDRGNYAFAIMQHNLMFNTSPSPSSSSSHSRSRNPSRNSDPDPDPDSNGPPPASPGHRPTNPKPDIPPTSRAQRAALRDFHATQNPELWGRRVGHGRQARLMRDENQGFWAWLGSLSVDEDRGRVAVMSAGSPWGLMGPPGHV